VERLTAVLRWFVLGAVLNAAVALIAYALQVQGVLTTDRINFAGARVSGLLIDPNAFGGLMTVALVLHLWTRPSLHRVWFRRGGNMVTLVLMSALVLTFSRSAWIGFVVAVGVAVLVRGAEGLKPLPKRFGLAVIVAITGILAVLPGALGLASRPEQISGRLVILRNALGDFLGSPVFGIGLGTFESKHQSNIVHNTVMWFAAEFGALGLIALLGFLAWYLRELVNVIARGPADLRPLALAVLLSQAAMIGLSTGIEAFYQRYWWLLFAAAGVLFSLCAKDASITGGPTPHGPPPRLARTVR
jgi:O-antigen ligase